MLARVLIKPKDGILDPQGKAVERALPTLGVAGVNDVRAGKLIEIDHEDSTSDADIDADVQQAARQHGDRELPHRKAGISP